MTFAARSIGIGFHPAPAPRTENGENSHSRHSGPNQRRAPKYLQFYESDHTYIFHLSLLTFSPRIRKLLDLHDIKILFQNAKKLEHQLLIHRRRMAHPLPKEALQLGPISINNLGIRCGGHARHILGPL